MLHPGRPFASLSRPHRLEQAALVLLLAVVLVLNLLTAERSPTVWLDEVSYLDPAVNLLAGNGFTSSAWYGQTRDAFWAGNVPLHALCLAGWMKIWGVGLVQARSLNYVLAALAALFFWRGTRAGQGLKSPLPRLGFATLLLSSFGMCYSYRSGRPDALLILLFALLFYAFRALPGTKRVSVLWAVSGLLPFAGLQALPLLAVTGGALLFWRRRAVVAEVTAMAAGGVAGIIALLLLYQSQGVLTAFLDSISSHHVLGQTQSLATLVEEKVRNSRTLVADLSLLVLGGGSLLTLLLFRRNLRDHLVAQSFGGLCFALVAALTVFSLGKFPLFYSWMAFVPVALVWANLLDETANSGMIRARNFLLGCGLVAAGLGLPLRLGITVKEWERRDYGPVRELVRENVTSKDCVFANFQAYYAVKPLAGETWVSSYARAITQPEKERVTCLIIAPKDYDETVRLIGGKWRDTGAAVSPKAGEEGLGAKPYDLRIWRRMNPPPP